MARYRNLHCQRDGGIAVLTVSRPEKLDALDGSTVDALDYFFRDAAADDSTQAVIVTGAGNRSFVAGTDIEAVSGFIALDGRAWGRQGQAMLRRIEALEKPVIAAINGYALGGGLEFAMACHLRVASTTARLGQPELRIGIVPGFGRTQRPASARRPRPGARDAADRRSRKRRGGARNGTGQPRCRAG